MKLEKKIVSSGKQFKLISEKGSNEIEIYIERGFEGYHFFKLFKLNEYKVNDEQDLIRWGYTYVDSVYE